MSKRHLIALQICVVVLFCSEMFVAYSRHKWVETARMARNELNIARVERDALMDTIGRARDAETALLNAERATFERLELPDGTSIPSGPSAADETRNRTTTYTYNQYGDEFRLEARPVATRTELQHAAVEVFLDRDTAQRIVVSSRMDSANRRHTTTTYYLAPDGELLLAVRARESAADIEERWYFVGNEFALFREDTVYAPRIHGDRTEYLTLSKFTHPLNASRDVADVRAELDVALDRFAQVSGPRSR